jgi:hypothetical protein
MIEREIILPMLGVFLGVGLPASIFDVAINSPRGGIMAGPFAASALILFVVSRRIGLRWPKLRQWAINNQVGATLFLFSGGFLCSLMSVIWYKIPWPIWLGYITAGIYMFFAIYILINPQTSEANSGR